MATFLVKFPIFRYHGNRGRLSKVWLTPLIWPTPKTPSWCKNLGRICCTSKDVTDFLLKIANFRCHGNKDMSEPNVTGIVNLADPENHTIEPKITTLSYIQPKLWQISLKFPIFGYHGNRGRLSKVWLTPLNWPIPKTPLVGGSIWGVFPVQAELLRILCWK